jgi:hypothetical protein
MTPDTKIAFDPWTATFEEAWKATEAATDSGVSSHEPDLPIYQYSAAQQINAMRKAIENGDGFSVLACMRKIATRGLITPKWLAIAYNKRYDAVLHCRAKSWDDKKAFGRPYKKGLHLNTARKARIGRLEVYGKIRDLLEQNPDLAIDLSLFESVGKMLNYGTTLTAEYYYQAKNMYGLK